jgi:hypothetical protein
MRFGGGLVKGIGSSSRLVVGLVFALMLVMLAFALPSNTSVASDEAEPNTDSAQAAAVVSASGGTAPEAAPTIELKKLAPGERAPQFVIVTLDGGCETRSGVLADLLDRGDEINGRFTFFLSGLCLLPDAQRMAYEPPGKSAGQSDLPFADADMVQTRLETLSRIYRSGHEVGTHFLGHFCGGSGVSTWSTAQWGTEITQSREFLDNWPKYNAQVVGAEPLPFDSSTFQGARTPCLEGNRSAMYAAYAEAGLRYEASDPGVIAWPKMEEKTGIWNFPLPALRLAGTQKWVLSMDYNFLANQNNAETEASPERCVEIEQQTYDSYMLALEAAERGSRAPLILGSHLNGWACDAYITSLHRFIVDSKQRFPDVQYISLNDLADWLELQDPTVLAELQALPAERDYPNAKPQATKTETSADPAQY